MAVLKSLVSLEVPTVFWLTVLWLQCTYTFESWDTRTVKPPPNPTLFFSRSLLLLFHLVVFLDLYQWILLLRAPWNYCLFGKNSPCFWSRTKRYILPHFFSWHISSYSSVIAPPLVLPVIILFSYQIFFFFFFFLVLAPTLISSWIIQTAMHS